MLYRKRCEAPFRLCVDFAENWTVIASTFSKISWIPCSGWNLLLLFVPNLSLSENYCMVPADSSGFQFSFLSLTKEPKLSEEYSPEFRFWIPNDVSRFFCDSKFFLCLIEASVCLIFFALNYLKFFLSRLPCVLTGTTDAINSIQF